MQPRSRRRRPSDSPPSDLAGEREQFLRTFLRKGAEITEELLREHDDLRSRVSQLEVENARLRTQLASDDAIRELLRRIDTLEREQGALLASVDSARRENDSFQSRYSEIEREFNDLATLYVAAFQLHSTLHLPRVVRHVKELLLQFIGADRFTLYLLDEKGKTLRAVAAEGLDLDSVAPVTPPEGPVGEAFATGIVSTRSQAAEQSEDEPLACIPLRVDDHGVGVIAIWRLLAQKRGFERVDRELFDMLIAHAATALVAANLFARVAEPERVFAGLAATG